MRAVLAERLNGLSGRARRAVALMLVAVLAVGAISLYYLRPWTAIQASLTTKPVAVVPTPGVGHITNFYFVSTALGWSVVTTYNNITNSQDGSYWVYKTVDAGKHWQRQLAGKTARLFLTFSSLWFADAHTGYVVAGDPIVLYKTHDGGEHWTKSMLPVADVQGLQFVDGTHGFVMTTSPDENFVFATADGGATWSELRAPRTNLSFWPMFRGQDEAWSGWQGSRPYVYLTVDGGVTWSRSLLPTPPDYAGQLSTWVDVSPPRPLVFAYVALEQSPSFHVYSTVDYGKSWTLVNLPSSSESGAALTGIDATHWWAMAGESTLYKTDDSGRSWVRIGTVPPNLRLLRIIDSRHAWAAQDSPDGATQLMLTSNGGVSWDSTNSPHPL
jgi:photosystem II stability/assembly factor-like uncharacterized protein